MGLSIVIFNGLEADPRQEHLYFMNCKFYQVYSLIDRNLLLFKTFSVNLKFNLSTKRFSKRLSRTLVVIGQIQYRKIFELTLSQKGVAMAWKANARRHEKLLLTCSSWLWSRCWKQKFSIITLHGMFGVVNIERV